MLRRSKLMALCIILTLSLVACGGGGGGGGTSVTGPAYTGSTTPATVSSSNVEPLGKAAADAASQTVSSEAATGSSLFAVVVESENSIPTAETTRLTVEIARKALAEIQSGTQNSVAGMVITSDQLNQEMMSNEFCGGSITVPDNTNFNGSTLDLTMTFNDLCYNDTINPIVIMNGTMRLIETDTSITVIFSNLSLSVGGGQAYTINATSTCDLSGINCTVDFEGSDGTTYRMGNLDVYEGPSGFDVSGTFYHPDYGSVTMTTTTPMTFNCAPAPQPDTGELAFSGDAGTSGRILFQGCDNFTVCYSDGVAPEVCNPQSFW